MTPEQFSDWCRKEDARISASIANGNLPDPKPVEAESDLHEFILNFCKSKFPIWLPVHSRMDRKSTNQIGTPDFIIFGPFPTVILIEAKARQNKMSLAQMAWATVAKLQGWTVHVVRSEQEFLQIVNAETKKETKQ